jgi:hypothetical protein
VSERADEKISGEKSGKKKMTVTEPIGKRDFKKRKTGR